MGDLEKKASGLTNLTSLLEVHISKGNRAEVHGLAATLGAHLLAAAHEEDDVGEAMKRLRFAEMNIDVLKKVADAMERSVKADTGGVPGKEYSLD